MSKWIGRVTLGLVALVVSCAGALYAMSSRRMAATFAVPVAAIETSKDSAVLDQGRRIATLRGCTDCHGEDLAGTVVIDEPPVARITATNLTSGRSGVGASYRDEDWVRAIRSGVRPDGSVLLVMPSYEYRAMGPEDLGALVSWIKSMPPVDSEPVSQTVGPIGRALFLAGQVPLIAAEMIDHDDPTFAQPEPGATVEYGAYLAASCVGCHGEDLTGGPIAGMPPETPVPANLTPHETGLGRWTRADFETLVERGTRPDGSAVDPFMPWQALQVMTPDEREAVWLFLRSLPPRASGED